MVESDRVGQGYFPDNSLVQRQWEHGILHVVPKAGRGQEAVELLKTLPRVRGKKLKGILQ